MPRAAQREAMGKPEGLKGDRGPQPLKGVPGARGATCWKEGPQGPEAEQLAPSRK